MQAIAFRIVRVIFWIALAIYLGGLVLLGPIAAKSIFQSLESVKATVADPASPLATPAQLGGEVFGKVLQRFGYLEFFACIGLIVTVLAESLLLRGAMLRKPWHLLRIGLIVCSLGLMMYDQLVLFPSAMNARKNWHDAITQAAAQATTTPGTTTASRPAVDPNFQATFDDLHKSSTSLGYTKAYFLLAILTLTALANTNVPPMRAKKLLPLPPKTETPIAP